jgi:hypothetical protein
MRRWARDAVMILFGLVLGLSVVSDAALLVLDSTGGFVIPRPPVVRRWAGPADVAVAKVVAAMGDVGGAPPIGWDGGPINWLAIAQCESGGNWYIDGLYDGGLQFDPGTWIAAGGGQYAAYAYLATPDEQIATAEAWVDKTGCVWCSSGWPVCGRYA